MQLYQTPRPQPSCLVQKFVYYILYKLYAFEQCLKRSPIMLNIMPIMKYHVDVRMYAQMIVHAYMHGLQLKLSIT